MKRIYGKVKRVASLREVMGIPCTIIILSLVMYFGVELNLVILGFILGLL